MPLPEEKKQEILNEFNEKFEDVGIYHPSYWKDNEDGTKTAVPSKSERVNGRISKWLSNTLDKVHDEAVEGERKRIAGAIKSMVIKEAAGSTGDKDFEIEVANIILNDTIKPKLLNLLTNHE